MPTAEDRVYPGEGWYEFKLVQHISYITIPEDEHGPRMEAPFLKVEVSSGDPTLLGMRGYGHPIYGVPLTALPFSTAPPEHHIGFPLYHFQNAFDQCINWAVDTLSNLGVAADVYRLRQIPHRQLEVKTMRRTVVGLERVVQQMWQQITTAEVNIECDEESIINRLHASRTVLRMASHIELDEEMGEVPGSVFYPRMMGTRALADLRLPPYEENSTRPSPTHGMAHTHLPSPPQHPPLPQP